MSSLSDAHSLHKLFKLEVDETSSSREGSVMVVVDLLEECWFYQNLLYRRTNKIDVPRCCSNPSHHSQAYFRQDILDNICSRGNKSKMTQNAGGSVHFVTLNRTVSLPQSNVREVVRQEKASIGHEADKVVPAVQQQSHRNLRRMPSLPPCIGRKEVPREKESGMKKVANFNAMTRPSKSFSASRHLPPLEWKRECMNMDGWKEMRRRYLSQRTMMRKSLVDLEFEEVQGFKDLGFEFDKNDLNPGVLNILPGLQKRKQIRGPIMDEEEEEKRVSRPYLSEAWLVQSCAPLPLPSWAAMKSEEDMKTQIKNWARALALNMQ